jgi:hypothetical protein
MAHRPVAFLLDQPTRTQINNLNALRGLLQLFICALLNECNFFTSPEVPLNTCVSHKEWKSKMELNEIFPTVICTLIEEYLLPLAFFLNLKDTNLWYMVERFCHEYATHSILRLETIDASPIFGQMCEHSSLLKLDRSENGEHWAGPIWTCFREAVSELQETNLTTFPLSKRMRWLEEPWIPFFCNICSNTLQCEYTDENFLLKWDTTKSFSSISSWYAISHKKKFICCEQEYDLLTRYLTLSLPPQLWVRTVNQGRQDILLTFDSGSLPLFERVRSRKKLKACVYELQGMTLSSENTNKCSVSLIKWKTQWYLVGSCGTNSIEEINPSAWLKTTINGTMLHQNCMESQNDLDLWIVDLLYYKQTWRGIKRR